VAVRLAADIVSILLAAGAALLLVDAILGPGSRP
jgi:hypothetical protein